MKITDGMWFVREGMRPQYAAEAYDITEVADGLLVHAPLRRIEHRGSVLNVGLLTVHLTAPLPGVIGVEVTHHAGALDRGPHVTVASDGADPEVRVGDKDAELRSGSLTARITRGAPWQLEFLSGGRVLTTSAAKSLGFVETPEGAHHMVGRLSLGVGEAVYGFGERFTALVKNGQVVESWNADPGTASEQAYKSVPFYLSDRGYGVLVGDLGGVSFEVASENTNATQFSVEGQTLRYYVVDGPTPAAVLERYTALVGRPALPPAWSFGLWLSTSFTTDYDEETVNRFVDGMAEREIPLSVFHFDCYWMREFNWSDFVWDSRVFPDPEGMLQRFRDRGLRISVWINPYIAQRSVLFEEGRRLGYLVERADGSVWQWDWWQAGMALVDFTNPAARAWYADKLSALLDMGVECFKTDFGERIPTDVVWHDGSDPQRMHNAYSVLYNETVFDLLQRRHGEGGAVVFARSATVGGQQFPVHWGGDSSSTYESMAESLRGGLSLGLSGFGFWSHDIGGFEGTPDAGVFKRWVAFGLLSSHSRLHGSGSYRVPWLVDDESVAVLRRFARLKNRLMPYLYGAAVTAHERGTPVLRAMALEFPDDPACTYLDRQYMLGPDLLVAPVFSEDGVVDYYVPAGSWVSLLTGERVEGPGWRREVHGYDSLPVLVRPGAVLPLGAREDRPDYAYADGLTLLLNQPAEGTQLRVVDTAGATAAVVTVLPDGLRAEGAAGWRAVELDGTVAPLDRLG
ncbi:alpha-D-xyloside xylohydrolase [Motilibacter rhizosphaerae]|uniref:alpha-D-xyloside xylohydrolase n=1 Tax=Motilibacter rhizosphaerae TaxID=598652 RepID=A0A4Q7NGQ4_9ACTN|nr:alpha-xylosidase [Motilibacter rhizosphaerae]RZS82974.1 alpha-D-xyloside xylohydrolase [Motilibacter rhizosphaerae]